RLISGGIWRSVSVVEKAEDHIDDIFMIVHSVDTDKNYARAAITFNVSVANDDLADYSLDIEGVCGDSSFRTGQKRLWHTGGNLHIGISNCKFWWPRNYGEPNLYETTATLKYKGEVVDTYTCKLGVRTVKLDRTSTTDKDGNGEFCFYINNKRVFVLGTNWVPVDAMHSNDIKRLPEILPMLNDIGCNAVRCWGGNVYEEDLFYDFCDENGIMIWQDFSMACAINPQDDLFVNKLKHEVEVTVKRLRNHASIILWAGDNECDSASPWASTNRDPNNNVLNRKAIPEVLWVHDYSRPYLPSSPYVDPEAFAAGGYSVASENHLWGPRDYFKGEFYRNTICHFASETGYHGCNSPESLKKFIAPDQLWHWKENPEDTAARRDWLVHASCMVADGSENYAYRIPLMANQVKTRFGAEPDNLDDFARASQISQAEAKKYFIERFRVTKWRRTGIIWWNLIDGWPQISDAVVDYYYCRKLAYHYIKRSQQAVCMIFDEPTGNTLPLHIVNDTDDTFTVTYKVTNLDTGAELINTACTAEAHDSVKVWNMNIEDGEKNFYYIEWSYTDRNGNTVNGANHYMTNILDISYDKYIENMKKCGFYDEFEGF
nr:glycoside hydrolase family 2 [Clostridia bacterium]